MPPRSVNRTLCYSAGDLRAAPPRRLEGSQDFREGLPRVPGKFLRHFHREDCVRAAVVELHALRVHTEPLHERAQPALHPVELFQHRADVVARVFDFGKAVAPALRADRLEVALAAEAQHEPVPRAEERADSLVVLRELGVPGVFLPAVCEMAARAFLEQVPVEGRVGVHQDVVRLDDREILIAEDIAEGADFPRPAEVVRALDVKKEVACACHFPTISQSRLRRAQSVMSMSLPRQSS